jgi:hypothetical protein
MNAINGAVMNRGKSKNKVKDMKLIFMLQMKFPKYKKGKSMSIMVPADRKRDLFHIHLMASKFSRQKLLFHLSC